MFVLLAFWLNRNTRGRCCYVEELPLARERSALADRPFSYYILLTLAQKRVGIRCVRWLPLRLIPRPTDKAAEETEENGGGDAAGGGGDAAL